MGLALEKQGTTLEEYLAWESVQETKNEFVDGEIFAMVGVRDKHNTVGGNVYMALRAHLKGSGCKAYASDIKLLVEAAQSVFYPDVFVTCEQNSDPLIKKDARLIVEVLSPSTEAYDRGRKFGFYRQLPGLAEYLLINCFEPRVELFRRAGESQWLLQEFVPGQSLHLESVGLYLPVDAIYEEVDFSEPTGEPPQDVV
ncbi:MAG: Uma2 family endonuclease [Rhodocyclaceae bacterium]|nr:Uma2 family endonuclease [Rhodocyclaceae bacterium]